MLILSSWKLHGLCFSVMMNCCFCSRIFLYDHNDSRETRACFSFERFLLELSGFVFCFSL